MILKERYYSTIKSSMICCGACIIKDIQLTREGKLVGEECVYEEDLKLEPEREPFQCDDCLEQNEAYENLDELD